jgi:hypothetical protein
MSGERWRDDATKKKNKKEKAWQIQVLTHIIARLSNAKFGSDLDAILGSKTNPFSLFIDGRRTIQKMFVWKFSNTQTSHLKLMMYLPIEISVIWTFWGLY